MKKFGTRLLTAVIASSLVVTPVMAAPSVDELKESKAQKESEVSSLQSQLTDIMSKLGELEEDLIGKGEEIIQAEEDLTEAEEKEQEQYEAMKKRIKFLYEQGDTSAIEAIITSTDFTDMINQAEYVQNVHTYDREQLQEYVETKEEIAELKTTLVEEKESLEELQVEYEEQEDELSTTIESKQSEVADLDAEIQAAAEAAARAAEEEERRRQEEAAAQENAAEESGSSQSSSTSTSSSTASTSNSTSSSSSSGGSGSTSTAQAIVSAAYSQLGVPYVWGGTSPGRGLDCSGLTQYCHRVAGITIGRTSQVQGGGGRAVSNPQPGDLVCYGSHIGIYIGNGQMIHAPHTGDVVRVASVYGSPWYRRYW